MPRPLLVDAGTTSFQLLMEACAEREGWKQHSTIPAGPPTRAVIRWLARFHAAFLPASRGGGGLPLDWFAH